jgi:hypothetical protein
MKKKILSNLIIASFVMFAISCTGKSGNQSTETKDSVKAVSNEQTSSSTPKKYDIKSAIVTYKTKVMGMNNSQELYFDDYGAKELSITTTEMNMMGMANKKVNATLKKDGYIYTYELENIVNKEDKLKKEIRKTKAFSMSGGDMSAAASMSAEMKKQYEYKDEGTESIAGVTGNKFSMKMGKTKMTGVLYKKVMLKTEMEMITIVADKFEENASVPAEKFELPKDYTIVETK